MTKASQPNLGIELQEELTRAAKVDIAVAYFSPDDKTLSALKNLSKLRLVISDDWQISNPRKIEKLKEADKVRRIISGDGGGKLHSKVYLIQRLDGSRWAMIGSANLTHQGLFSNQEAVITLDSNVPGDGLQIAEAERWFLEVWRDGKDQIDFEMAKTIFDTRSKYRMSFVEKTVIEKSHGQKAVRYWALKTTSGPTGEGHWPKFLAEKVVAIGWEDLEGDPAKMNSRELRDALGSLPEYQTKSPSTAARLIAQFTEMSVGDKVLICRGYPPNSDRPVQIFGIAKIDGEFFNDLSSTWWRFKRSATIQEINQQVPREIVSGALNKDSLMQTIHELSSEAFKRLEDVLAEDFE